MFRKHTFCFRANYLNSTCETSYIDIYPFGLYTLGKYWRGWLTISGVNSSRIPSNKLFLSLRNHLKGDSGTSCADRRESKLSLFLKVLRASFKTIGSLRGVVGLNAPSIQGCNQNFTTPFHCALMNSKSVEVSFEIDESL